MTNQLRARAGAPAIERNHWFPYKYIGAQDLVAEQDYLVSRHRAHNRLLHGCGVVCGLRVHRHPRPDCDADWVVVGAGIAIDALGRELILPEDTPHRLPVQEHHGGSFVVCIRYREERVQEVPILYANPDGGLPYSDANRIREGVEIVAVPVDDFDPDGWQIGSPGCIDPAPATDDELVALALAEVDPDGKPVRIHNRARRIGLPTHQPARIVELSWEHGRPVHLDVLQKDRRLKLTFDRPLAPAEDRARGVGPETFSLTCERRHDSPRTVPSAGSPSLADDEYAAVFEIAEEAFEPKHEAYLGDSLVRVTLRCDFILDRDGVPASGRHVGGRLPTGAGGAGGTFESWFEVTTEAAGRRTRRRAERDESKEQT
jgi:hypothetical protein